MTKYQDLSRFRMPDGFRGRPGWYVQAWWLVQTCFFHTSPQFLYGWRRWLLRLFGARVGKGVVIRPTASVQFPWKVTIGDYAWVGDEVNLYSLGGIHIGDNAVISQRSYICTGSHRADDPTFPITQQPIVIEAECWVATDVFVGPGVTIGRGTVVGARSSVFTSLPPGKVCLGSPARVVGDRATGKSTKRHQPQPLPDTAQQ